MTSRAPSGRAGELKTTVMGSDTTSIRKPCSMKTKKNDLTPTAFPHFRRMAA